MQAMSAPPGGRTRPGKRDNGAVSPAVRPRWIVLSIFVTVFTVTCVVLGFWQLGRLEERRASNAVVGSRLARAPVGLALLREALLPQEGAATDPSYYEFTRVTAEGRLMDEGRVLVRSQVAAGQAGTHAVFPLDLGDGAAVLVNVGWFPLGVEPAPGRGPLPSVRADDLGRLAARRPAASCFREAGTGRASGNGVPGRCGPHPGTGRYSAPAVLDTARRTGCPRPVSGPGADSFPR